MSNISHLDKAIIYEGVEGTNFASIKRSKRLRHRERNLFMRVCDLKFDRAFRNEVNKRDYEI